MSDLFDLEIPSEWFAEAWGIIAGCGRVHIQIVTKRLPAVRRRLAETGCTRWPAHAGLMATAVNQAEAARDVPRLLKLKCDLGIPWVGISCEPLLGPLDLSPWLSHEHGGLDGRQPCDDGPRAALDWVIAGGESGASARPMHPDWPRSLRDQCTAAGVPFFFKQWGNFAPLTGAESQSPSFRFDDGMPMERVGKKAAGRRLDGIEHNAMPALFRGAA